MISKFAPNDENFLRFEVQLLKELPLEFDVEIKYLKIFVKKFDDEDVRVRTIIVCKKEILDDP